MLRYQKWQDKQGTWCSDLISNMLFDPLYSVQNDVRSGIKQSNALQLQSICNKPKTETNIYFPGKQAQVRLQGTNCWEWAIQYEMKNVHTTWLLTQTWWRIILRLSMYLYIFYANKSSLSNWNITISNVHIPRLKINCRQRLQNILGIWENGLSYLHFSMQNQRH